ncbi:MAG: hypothetical protein AB7H97_00145 [Pseudobdellovibrionaceae bacterium]
MGKVVLALSLLISLMSLQSFASLSDRISRIDRHCFLYRNGTGQGDLAISRGPSYRFSLNLDHHRYYKKEAAAVAALENLKTQGKCEPFESRSQMPVCYLEKYSSRTVALRIDDGRDFGLYSKEKAQRFLNVLVAVGQCRL